MAKGKYTSEDIKVLNDREHVRLRTQVYLGNMTPTSYPIPLFDGNDFSIKEIEFIPAVYKAVGEIIDNSIDEFAQINTKNKVLKIEAEPINGWYCISDNGRGIPISKHSSGKYTPEVALGSLRAGRNFGEDKEAGVIGQNGVGSACTNYCSTEFNIVVNRDGKKYIQSFEDGALKISKPSIRKGPKTKTGTEVSFTLDDGVFKDVSIDSRLIRNKAIEVALTNPGITVQYNKEKFKFNKGIEDFVRQMTKTYGGSYFKFCASLDGLEMEFFVIDGIYESIDEQMFTWVNSSLLFDGGLVNTQFLNAFVSETIKSLKVAAKREKIEITKNDVRQNLLILANLKIADPEYDAQSKTRLTGPNLRKEMSDLIAYQWPAFIRKNRSWLDTIIERAKIRHHASENKKAIKEHKKVSRQKIKGLVDATSRYRQDCSLLITEGESAASMITEARDPKTIGSYALTGKINNVYGKTVAQVLNMGKLTDLLAACGLTPGVRTSIKDLRYGKLIIATDADFDGDDIFTLLVNVFYQFWPELFESPIVHRLVAPNVCLTKGNKRVHFATREAYEKQKRKYKGWDVHYYKGLGSMERADWDMILSGDTDTLIPITNDNTMESTLELLFGTNSEARKAWLQ
jgi:DNA gyrase/topoisomerase IV subunit B